MMSGAVIPGAEITATNNANGAEVTGSTDADGAYELTLEPGIYKITAETPGFATGIADDVELIAGQSVLRNFTLELAACHHSPSWSSAAAPSHGQRSSPPCPWT